MNPQTPAHIPLLEVKCPCKHRLCVHKEVTTMAFVPYNPNPKGTLTGDCAIREMMEQLKVRS